MKGSGNFHRGARTRQLSPAHACWYFPGEFHEFSDYNHFGKVSRKHLGSSAGTPLQLRRRTAFCADGSAEFGRAVEFQLENWNRAAERVGVEVPQTQFRAAVAIVDQRLQSPLHRFAGVQQRHPGAD